MKIYCLVLINILVFGNSIDLDLNFRHFLSFHVNTGPFLLFVSRGRRLREISR